MTREEIENALLTTGIVDIDAGDAGRIVLSAPSSRRLVKVVLDRARSSTVEDLTKNEQFFDVLEAAFIGGDGMEMGLEASDETGEPEAKSDSRTWRLKKVETTGFGGLNAVPGDVFEFDIAGQDFCIEGQNGSGKSSLANAVLFAITGKIHRDQHGLWNDPTRVAPVVSDEGTKLGDWPPIATYPDKWGSVLSPVDVSVTLTFGNDTDNEEIEARRRLHGESGTLQHDVSIDPRLTAVPALIEAGLLMPMRIQHIRVPESDDNGELVGLIRQLIGLEPLLDVADLVDKLVHGNQQFLKYARINHFDGKREHIVRLLSEAQEMISELNTGLVLTVAIELKKPVNDERLRRLGEAREELDRRQAKGFQTLAALAFEEFDPDEAEHRQGVTDAITRLNVDSSRQNDRDSLPPVLKGIALMDERVGKEDFQALKSALKKASRDISTAIEWADRRKEDTLLRLKAVAAAHFEDCKDPSCPLCQQSINDAVHPKLVEDLRILKTDAEAAQTQLGDASRRIEQEVRRAAENVVPDTFMRVMRFAVKRNIQDQVRATFVEADHVAAFLPGFVDIAQAAVDAAFAGAEEVEFGSALPEAPEGDEAGRVRRLLDHLEDTVKAAENWQQSCQAFREA